MNIKDSNNGGDRPWRVEGANNNMQNQKDSIESRIKTLLVECDTGQARRQWRELLYRIAVGLLFIAVFALGQAFESGGKFHDLTHDVHVHDVRSHEQWIEGRYSASTFFWRQFDPLFYRGTLHAEYYTL